MQDRNSPNIEDAQACARVGCQLSPRYLAKFARQCGYRCDSSCLSFSDIDIPVTEGVISSTKLPCGLQLHFGDLTASRDNEQAAIIPQSLTTILRLGGHPTRYRLGSIDHILEPEAAIVVTAADYARLSAEYRQGDQSRSFVLYTSPDRIDDDDLAEQLYRKLNTTDIKPLSVNDRVRALTNELFTVCHTGPIEQLLAESCALEILARGLSDDIPYYGVSRMGMSTGDVAGIQRVRELILSNIKADHRLCDLARVAGMSVTSLKSKFSSIVGQSVFEFLRNQRLERAQKGLKDEGWTVKQAAFAVGYAHPSNFSTAYRKRFGITPLQTRSE